MRRRARYDSIQLRRSDDSAIQNGIVPRSPLRGPPTRPLSTRLLRVEFATGGSVVVPPTYEGFESSRATVVDTLMPGPPQIDSTEYPEFNEAIRQFAEELQREDDEKAARRESARRDDPPGA
jgi:hypothetical protein